MSAQSLPTSPPSRYPTLRLSPVEVEKIERFGRPLFLEVQEHTGVPWQALAAVWYRESFSITPPERPGGSFQFDPIPSNETLRRVLVRFSDLNAERIEVLVAMGINIFHAAAYFAACWLRRNARAVITPDATDDEIKDAFWGYNGRAYGSADNSPYVMNGWDENHMDMVIRGTLLSKDGSKVRVRTVDKRPGAFCVYKHLKESE